MTIVNPAATKFEQAVSLASIESSKKIWGQVTRVVSQSVHIQGLSIAIGLGDQIEIKTPTGSMMTGEIIALNPDEAIAIMYNDPFGIRVGSRAYFKPESLVSPSSDWIGKVLDHSARTVDGQTPLEGPTKLPLRNKPPPAILRKPLGSRLDTGIAAIDTFLPLCQGQRMGLFAGSGIGKSTLLAALARGTKADVIIIALIGERGREVRSFVENTLGEEGMEKSIVFVATSNDPSALKLRTALLALTTAESFRDEGKQVLVLFDSITRFAEAHRDVALTAGEIPSLRAYPPSTFRALAALCERTGPGIDGSGDITAVFSVLVAGSNMEEPIADMVRGILDGHIVLDREIAERGRYPAIDVRRSVSRSLPEAASPEENEILNKGRALIGAYEDARPLIQSGLYASGSDPVIDNAIEIYPSLDGFVGSLGDADATKAFDKLAEILTIKATSVADVENLDQATD
ncbi:MAG: FliI/YscN family ATPase [Acidimicrobiales bacterium]|nr:FliI/YscN family ATPase [Hyphomonadaceae bacterium]RZV44767.1 MAG: FliI/YscN family ATPase [Acidimicrobiales bacterium]